MKRLILAVLGVFAITVVIAGCESGDTGGSTYPQGGGVASGDTGDSTSPAGGVASGDTGEPTSPAGGGTSGDTGETASVYGGTSGDTEGTAATYGGASGDTGETVPTGTDSETAVYAGLAVGEPYVYPSSGVLAKGDTSSNQVSQIGFQITTGSLADSPIDMTKTILNYTDKNGVFSNIKYDFQDLTTGSTTTLGLSDTGQITIHMSDITGTSLGAGDYFQLELIPIVGGNINLQRTLPGVIQAEMDLY